MIYSRRCWGFVIFFIVLISKTNGNKHRNKDGSEALPPDFMSFVKSLDSMVFQPERMKNISRNRPIHQTLSRLTQKIPNRRYNNDNLEASQTAAIRDILMLKLVSYYEDKYNVARTKAYTTPPMLESMEGRTRFDRADGANFDGGGADGDADGGVDAGADSVEKTARTHEGAKRPSSNYAENVQHTYTNQLDASQEQNYEEVVVL